MLVVLLHLEYCIWDYSLGVGIPLNMSSQQKAPSVVYEKPIQLIRANLPEVGKRVRIPSYDPVPPGSNTIVHLSVGGFHRAHQAVYLDDLLEAGKTERWHLIGVGLLPFDIPARDAMQAQDCLYTLVERDAKGDNARIISSIAEYYYAPERPRKSCRL